MSGTIYARGVNKTISIAEETVGFGIASTGSGQLLRRNNFAMNLSIQPIESQEILPSQQERDWRLGPRQVQGTLSAQLSPGSFKNFFEGLLRARFTVGSTVSGVSDTTVAAGGTPDQSTLIIGSPVTPNVLSSTATNFFTSGFRVGDVFRISSIGSGEAALVGANYQIIGFDASGKGIQMNPALPAWTLAQYGSVSLAVAGKKVHIPATGQIPISYTFEEWYSDVGQSRVYTGCRINQITLNMPASGFVTMQASVTGQNMTSSTTQAYPSAAAVDTETSLTAVSGSVLYRGVPIFFITSLNVTIRANTEAPPVIGSNISPYIFQGTVMVTGSFTCFLADDVLQQDYLNEAEVTIAMLLTTSPLATADFINVVLPRVKLSGTTISDSDMSLTRSFNFQALENTGSNAYADLTTVIVQDSAA